MDEDQANEILCLHLEGTINLISHPNTGFDGILKKGLRLILWGESNKRATTMSFLGNVNIAIGEVKVCQIVLLSPKSIDKKIRLNEYYFIGTPNSVMAKFVITRIIGMWEGKVP